MLTIIMGKSSGGKDTLQEELIKKPLTAEELKEIFEKLISTTSRPMREGEVEGREYYFTNKEGFLDKVKEGYFIEYRDYKTKVNGVPAVWYYGLGKQLDKEQIANGDYVTILDPGGAEECIKYYGRENCFIVYVELDDITREYRASHGRGGFDKTEWDRRLEDDNIRFSDENIAHLVNARIENTGTVKDLVHNFKVLYIEYMERYKMNRFHFDKEDVELDR